MVYALSTPKFTILNSQIASLGNHVLPALSRQLLDSNTKLVFNPQDNVNPFAPLPFFCTPLRPIEGLKPLKRLITFTTLNPSHMGVKPVSLMLLVHTNARVKRNALSHNSQDIATGSA